MTFRKQPSKPKARASPRKHPPTFEAKFQYIFIGIPYIFSLSHRYSHPSAVPGLPPNRKIWGPLMRLEVFRPSVVCFPTVYVTIALVPPFFSFPLVPLPFFWPKNLSSVLSAPAAFALLPFSAFLVPRPSSSPVLPELALLFLPELSLLVLAVQCEFVSAPDIFAHIRPHH